MEKIEVKLEKDNNDFFREWIIKEWQHHNIVDPIYQLRIIKPEEKKFKENNIHIFQLRLNSWGMEKEITRQLRTYNRLKYAKNIKYVKDVDIK